MVGGTWAVGAPGTGKDGNAVKVGTTGLVGAALVSTGVVVAVRRARVGSCVVSAPRGCAGLIAAGAGPVKAAGASVGAAAGIVGTGEPTVKLVEVAVAGA